MPQNDHSRLSILFIGSLVVITIAMMVVIFVATRRPVVVMLPSGVTAGGTANTASGGTGAAGETAGAESVLPAPLPEVSVVRVASAPAADHPLDPAWESIAAVNIPLEKQQSSEPMLERLTIPQFTVQAARDDRRFVWRISWPQAKACYRSNVGEFSDAVSIQFPLKDGAPYTMGGPGMPVVMLYWKALWQKDIDEGFQDVQNVYPNAWSDFYWFARGTGPQPVAESFEDAASHQFMSGRAAGNPMANAARTRPIEELSAQGFGSSTHVPQTASNGRGIWQDGTWYVVFDRPVDGADPLVARFNQNPSQQLIAFAIWDGNDQNRGGRKHITNWIPMRIEP
jgi:hypothetical protein